MSAAGGPGGEWIARVRGPALRFATVSGILTTRPALIEWVDRCVPEIQLITTKSYQVRPNPGYREPVLVEAAPGCYGNAVGLRNPGMEEGFRELEALRRRRPLRALLCVSLSAGCPEDFALLARRFTPVADLLELNFSCPHAAAGYGSAIGSDASTVGEYLRVIRRATHLPLLAKLTPNVADIGAIARAAVQAGADGISAINTVGPEVFRDPGTGLPVLSNPKGGGKSGEWIRAVALEKVAQIRRAVGPELPIVGMGGVSSAEDALALRAAGADLIGLGSVLARLPRQELIPPFVRALADDAAAGGSSARQMLGAQRLMEYRPLRVGESREISPTLRLLTLEGRLEAKPSQYVFAFLPGAGEKPFSLAGADPVRLLVRRRGPFTERLCGLQAGDRLLLRGPYGAAAPPCPGQRAIIVAGGTGVAVAPLLAAQLSGEGRQVRLFFGASLTEELCLPEALDVAADCLAVPDSGRPARVLEELSGQLPPGEARRLAFYLIGPEGFLHRAVVALTGLGARAARTYLCLETPSLCGVGLCGSCECGGRLLCKEGTFVSLEHLRLHGMEPRADDLEAATAGSLQGAADGPEPVRLSPPRA